VQGHAYVLESLLRIVVTASGGKIVVGKGMWENPSKDTVDVTTGSDGELILELKNA
jgi:hypothetical protein